MRHLRLIRWFGSLALAGGWAVFSAAAAGATLFCEIEVALESEGRTYVAGFGCPAVTCRKSLTLTLDNQPRIVDAVVERRAGTVWIGFLDGARAFRIGAAVYASVPTDFRGDGQFSAPIGDAAYPDDIVGIRELLVHRRQPALATVTITTARCPGP